MKPVLRRHPVATFVAVAVVLVAAGVALAPWWIDLGPVRAKIERAASSALAGTLTYERMDLSWFPRPEVVVRSAKLSVPGVRGTVRSVRVSPAVLPLLRGRVVLARIGVEGLDLSIDLREPGPETRPASPAASDWTQALRSLGTQTLDVTVGKSRLVLARPAGRSLTLEGLRVEAALRVAEGKAELAISRLSMESPALALEANLRADAGGPSIEATARGSDLDVTDVRGKLLAFLGDDPTVAEIFGIVRGGKLTSFTFATSGKAPGDLGILERMTIHAAVADAKVRIEEAGLDLADVTGDAALEGGVLSSENATARVGKSRASGGKVLIGLAPGDDRLRVEARVKADLAEVPAILARAIPDRAFRNELALVEGLVGSATGRITIGDRKSDVNTSVAVSEMRFSARYRRIPWPVRVDRGEFTFDGKRTAVNRLSGSLGRSTFSGLKARVRLGRKTVLESASGSFRVSLEDFFEGVRTRPGAEALARDVRRVSGSVSVDVQRLAGPLARLGEASLAASGTFKEILLSSSSLPPLSIPSGRFTASDDAIRVEDTEARTLDAALRVSGAWNGYRKGAGTIEAVADGELGAEAIRWGWERAALPVTFRPAAPIALHGGRFGLGSGALTLAGEFVVAKGPRVALDMTQEGGKTDVRDLRIADGDALASMGLRLEAKDLDVRFQGRLAASTLAKLFGERPWRSGTLEGDVRVHVPLASPAGLTADGTLTATSFGVPTPAGVVAIERLEARAAKNRIDVVSSSLVLDEQRFSAAGSATFGGDAIVLDMDVATGDLSYARVEKVLNRVEDAKKKTPAAAVAAEAKGASSKPAVPTPLAIGGAIRVSLDSFSWGNFVFKPVLADVRLGADAVTAHVRKADLCGIATTGEARFLPGGAIAVDARADAAGPDINVPLTCLGLENSRMTGSYEASVQVAGEGPASELVRSVRGPLTFKALKGRIGKATVLTRILGVVNATDVFKGASKTRLGEAMPYDAITLEGEIAEDNVSIREAAMKAPAMTMAASGTVGLLDQSLDLTVLAHPLSTVDKVVQAVPVVRTVLGRNFLAVAVKVTGTIGDPKATVTPGRDVGKGLVGILERTVTLPVTVFDPPPR